MTQTVDANAGTMSNEQPTSPHRTAKTKGEGMTDLSAALNIINNALPDIPPSERGERGELLRWHDVLTAITELQASVQAIEERLRKDDEYEAEQAEY